MRFTTPGLEIVLGVVGGVAEEEDVTGRGFLPVVVSVGEEGLEGVGGGFAETELVVDVLDGHGPGPESLALSEVQERLGGGEEVTRPDDEVVGTVADALEGARKRPSHLGPEEGGRRDRDVAVAGLRPEAQAALPEPGPREPARSGLGRIQEDGVRPQT